MAKTRKRNVHVSGRRKNGAHRSEYDDGVKRGENLDEGDPQHLVPLCLKTASSKVRSERAMSSTDIFGHGTEVIWADADESFLLPRLRHTVRSVQIRDRVWRTRHTNFAEICKDQRVHRHLGTTMALSRAGLSGMAAVKNRDASNKRTTIAVYRAQAETLRAQATECGIDVDAFYERGGTLKMLARAANTLFKPKLERSASKERVTAQ